MLGIADWPRKQPSSGRPIQTLYGRRRLDWFSRHTNGCSIERTPYPEPRPGPRAHPYSGPLPSLLASHCPSLPLSLTLSPTLGLSLPPPTPNPTPTQPQPHAYTTPGSQPN